MQNLANIHTVVITSRRQFRREQIQLLKFKNSKYTHQKNNDNQNMYM